MEQQMDEETIQRHKEAFQMFDKDGSGFIEFSEFGDSMRCAGENPTESDLQNMLSLYDTNDDKKIDFDEYLKMVSASNFQPNGEKEIREACRHFDKDGRGYLNKEELRAILQDMGSEPLNNEEVNEIFNDIDTDKDGNIQYEEFVKFLTSV